ncbi:hypothetical protein NDU88_005344 [Pleurodeles waltl]|uniref:Uncharacterized protein n=1 Tax=Pleurodeles waltl TaxID=8319 RepID=A0AAV7RN10_PLEWA|nr:hypothetical protein NDU88_005344 [Pleurodeles waltl]
MEEYPQGTLESDPHSNTHANPEEEGLLRHDAGRGGKEGDAERRGRERTNEVDAELGKLKEEKDAERVEESSERSSEAERAWETEFPAKDGQTP